MKENFWGTKTTTTCAARLVVRMPTNEVKWLVFENTKEHDHDNVKTKIQPEVRKKVETLQGRNLKPATIAEILDVELGSDAPKQNQIYNIIRQTKTRDKANYYLSVSDMAEWVG